jgi:hypothetical protein
MKKDTNNLVTRGDLKIAMREIKEKMYTKADHAKFVESLKIWQKSLHKSLQGEIDEIKAVMYTKQDHARDMVWMDEAITELRDARDERKLSEHQIIRLDDKVVDHEKRISVLEDKKLCSN